MYGRYQSHIYAATGPHVPTDGSTHTEKHTHADGNQNTQLYTHIQILARQHTQTTKPVSVSLNRITDDGGGDDDDDDDDEHDGGFW